MDPYRDISNAMLNANGDQTQEVINLYAGQQVPPPVMSKQAEPPTAVQNTPPPTTSGGTPPASANTQQQQQQQQQTQVGLNLNVMQILGIVAVLAAVVLVVRRKR